MEGRGVEAQKIRTLYRGFGVAVTIKGLLGDVQVVKDSVESKVSRPFVLMEIVPTCHFGATKQSTVHLYPLRALPICVWSFPSDRALPATSRLGDSWPPTPRSFTSHWASY